MDKEMMRALEADGEKLRQLTGEEHGPIFTPDHCDCGLPFVLEEERAEGKCTYCAILGARR